MPPYEITNKISEYDNPGFKIEEDECHRSSKDDGDDDIEICIDKDNNRQQRYKNVAKARTKIPHSSDRPKPVPYFSLFQYATAAENWIIILGVFLGMISGTFIPAVNVIYGEYANLLVDRQFPQPVGSSKANVLEIFGGGRPLTNATWEERKEALYEDARSFSFAALTFAVLQLSTAELAIFLLNYTALKQTARIRKKFFKAILRKDMAWFDINGSSQFTSQITEDLNRVEQGIGERLVILFYQLSTTGSTIIVCLFTGWQLTLVLMGGVSPLIFTLITGSKIQSHLTSRELKSYGLAGAVAEEVFNGIRTVVAFNGQDLEVDRYEDKLRMSKSVGIKKGITSGVGSGVLWFITYSTYAVAFSYGVRLIVWSREAGNTEYTPGVLIIVFFGVVVAATNMGYAVSHFETFAVARGAASEIFDIINHQPRIDPLSEGGMKKTECKGDIEFRNVRFAYPARPNIKILNGLNLKINAGEMVAIVGGSGAGKSTILELVQRKYDPAGGDVFLDGDNYKALNLHWLRQQLGVVGQEPLLFACSIRDNIAYGAPNPTEAEIIAAAKKANAHNFIMAQPEGYDTLIGQKGSTLSGGQRQRIAIARALIRDPKILILDEATSALDATSEKLVQDALDVAAIGRTTLVVTHRLTTITNADRIIVLGNGAVIEDGTHEELLSIPGGVYAELLKNQEENKQVKKKSNLKFEQGSTPTVSEMMERAEQETYQEPQPVGPGPRTRDSFIDGSKQSKIKLKRKKRKKDAEALDQTLDVSVTEMLGWNRPEWFFLIGGALASVLAGAALPLVCILFGNLYGFLSISDSELLLEKTDYYTMLLMIIGVVAGISIFIQLYFFAVAGMGMTTRLRIQAFDAIVRQEIGWFDEDRNKTGALCSRLSQDAAGVQAATGGRIGIILQSLSTMAISVIVSLTYSWKLTLVTLVTVPFVFIGVYLETLLLASLDENERKAMEGATKVAVEVLNNIKAVSSLGREQFFYEKFADALKGAEMGMVKRAHLRGIAFGVGQTAPLFGYSLALWYGGVLVAEEGLHYENVVKVGELLIFGAWTLGQSVVFAPSLNKAKASAGRLKFLFTRTPQIRDGHITVAPDMSRHAEIRFNKITFAYPTRLDKIVLNQLNLKIKSGTSIALVGSSGCGKSTIIQLLQRLYDPQVGAVMFNNVNIGDLTLPALRKRMGLVGQEPILFDRTIRENIAYGDTSRVIPDAEIFEAAKAANIHVFITSLPKGYDTRLGSTSAQLSGGQKQRIAIARALVRNPQILLLDEATSALDPRSEKTVQEALDKASSGRTTITIAHRLGAVMNCDIIYVLDKGRVIESGNHTQLMSQGGFYYEMHKSQK